MDRSKDNMRDVKVYKSIKYLDVYELNKFKKFVDSPYFNSNAAIQKLFSEIYKDLKNRQKAVLSKQKVYQSIYGKQEYDDAKLRKLNSILLELFAQFLAQQIYDKDPLRQANYMLEYINSRKIKELYNSTIKSAQKISKKVHIKSSSNYYHDFLLENNLHTLREEDLKRFQETNIEEISSNLDKFYIVEKLRFYTTKVLAQKSFIAKDYKFHFIEEITRHLLENSYEQDPIIQLYFLNLQMVSNPEELKSYWRYKSILLQYIDEFSSKEAVELTIEAINYAIRKINSGKSEFNQEIYELYKFLVESNLMIQSNDFNHWDYKNIVIIGLKVREYDWVEHFVEDYSKYLPEEYRENAYSYNLALLHFHNQKFKKSLSILQQVSYNDLTYNLNSKLLLMANYFELQEWDALDTLSDTFGTFLSRKKELSATRKSYYTNYIKMVKKLSNSLHDRDAMQKLGKKIQTLDNIPNKEWMLQKIGEADS